MKITELLLFFKKWLVWDRVWLGAFKMDTTKERAICLYARGKAAANNVAVGGAAATGYRRTPMTAILRWTTDAVAAEQQARTLYEAIAERTFIFDGRKGFLLAVYADAVPLGTDQRGIYEYAVDFDAYFEENSEMIKEDNKYGISSKQY